MSKLEVGPLIGSNAFKVLKRLESRHRVLVSQVND